MSVKDQTTKSYYPITFIVKGNGFPLDGARITGESHNLTFTTKTDKSGRAHLSLPTSFNSLAVTIEAEGYFKFISHYRLSPFTGNLHVNLTQEKKSA